jgi:hypothetical protein
MPVVYHVGQGYRSVSITAGTSNDEKTVRCEGDGQRNIQSRRNRAIEAQNPIVKVERHRAFHGAAAKLHGSIVNSLVERRLLGA